MIIPSLQLFRVLTVTVSSSVLHHYNSVLERAIDRYRVLDRDRGRDYVLEHVRDRDCVRFLDLITVTITTQFLKI